MAEFIAVILITILAVISPGADFAIVTKIVTCTVENRCVHFTWNIAWRIGACNLYISCRCLCDDVYAANFEYC